MTILPFEGLVRLCSAMTEKMFDIGHVISCSSSGFLGQTDPSSDLWLSCCQLIHEGESYDLRKRSFTLKYVPYYSSKSPYIRPSLAVFLPTLLRSRFVVENRRNNDRDTIISINHLSLILRTMIRVFETRHALINIQSYNRWIALSTPWWCASLDH